MNHQEQIQPQWKLIIGFALALLITVGSLLSGSGAIGISGSIIALILVTAIAFINIHNTQNNLGAPISQVKHLVDEISMGNFSNASENTGAKNNSLASKLQALAYSQQEKQNEIEASQASTQRIISALNVCNTNVMMADDDYNIVYMNDSVKEMMQSAEADLKVVLPNFNAQALMGESIDVFHKNPAHQRSMLEGLQTQYNGKIQVGTRTFSLIATPIFDDEHQRLGTVVEWDDQTAQLAKEQAEAQLAADNTRIKLALDVCSTNVMMADAEFNIIYMNESVQEMMKTAESDLKAELSRFDADNLIGNNIDIFHKNPAHQRSMLEKLTSTYQTNITVGPRTFNLIATPIFAENKERIGTVVEWNDRTEALAQETKAKQLAEENAGVRLALDVCNTNVMMADANYNINYMNKAVQNMMRVA
ncbi:PAS domain-containing protein, partial [Oleiphilus sp. HI0123]